MNRAGNKTSRLAARWRSLRRCAAAEDGFVMVVVVYLLMLGLLFGAAALAESLDTRSHANLDTRERRALQAADAGIQAVLYRENQLDLDSLDLTGGTGAIGTLADCLVPNLNSGLPANGLIAVSVSTGGECPVGQKNGANAPFSTTVATGDHDSYNVAFIPNASTTNATSGVQFLGGKIVSLGIDDNGNPSSSTRYVYAKVQASLAPVDPFKTVEALHDLTFQVPLATAFNGTARAGHQLFFDLQNSLVSAFTGANILGTGSTVIGPTSIDVGCQGNAGPSYQYTLLNKNILSVFAPVVLGGINLASPQTCGPQYWFTRPPISVSASKADCPGACSSLTGYPTSGNNDDIYITNHAQLNLAPGDYVFCSFQTNGPVNVTATATSAPVRIFIDSHNSSRCSSFVNHSPQPGFSAGPGNFLASQGIGGLVGGVAGTLSPTQVQVYVVGDGTNNDTTATSGPASAADAFFLYAPQSKVTVSSTVSFAGTAIGYDVTTNTILYSQDLGLNRYPFFSNFATFRVAQYSQCSKTGGSSTPTGLLTGTATTDTSGC